MKTSVFSKVFSLPFGFFSGIWQLIKEGSRKNYLKRTYPYTHFDYGAYANDNCDFEKNVTIGSHSELHNCKVGHYSYFQKKCIVRNCNIGRFCSIGPHSHIGLGIHPIGLNVSTSPIFYMHNVKLGFTFVKKDTFNQQNELITIGNDVWIGTRTIITDGVTVGDGAIIGAGTVVTKDIPPYAIFAGVPGKVIKYRFSEDIIATLLKRPWWENDTSWLKKNFQLLQNVNELISYIKQFKNNPE